MRQRLLWAILAILAPFGTGCSGAQAPAPLPRQYLYLWTGSADSTEPDFLAVLDVTEGPDRYGDLVTTVPVPGLHNTPHHTEHEMAADRQLFVNGFGSGQSWVFDLSQPASPRIAAQFGDVAGLSHPHSFLRLPDGNILATYQIQHGPAGMTAGGLVELTPSGGVLRSVSADRRGLDPGTRVYSAGVVPALDRIVTTTTDMHGGTDGSNQLQIWRLSDLTLLNTVVLPNGPNGDEGLLTAEPRVLSDGRTVLVSTFNCGLFLLAGLEGTSPSGHLVGSFPMKSSTHCAVPVVAGHYYLVTVPAFSAVVSLDIADPEHPREVSRAVLDSSDVPHWISISPDRRRVVVTGYGTLRNRVMLLRFDPATGALSVDGRFREPDATRPGYQMTGKTWPHGGHAAGIPHGAVFGIP